MIASAHGRPRLIRIEDCTIERLSLEDFPNPSDPRNDIFRFYVAICGILGDLCEMLMRRPHLSATERNTIGADLLRWIQALPERLRLYDRDGNPRPYDFEVAKLHTVYFSAVTILFRPSSVYQLAPSNTASVIASSMNCHLFEAFQLRDQAHFLSGPETWQLLVTAIPQLASWPIATLWQDAQSSLDIIEDVLTTLGRKLPSATNNLRNVRLLRSAITNGSITASSGSREARPEELQCSTYFCPLDLFESFGADVATNYRQVEKLLGELPGAPSGNGPVEAPLPTAFLPNNGLSPFPPVEPELTTMSELMTGEGSGLFEGLTGFDPFDQSNWMMNWVFDQNIVP
jgi:hypothetical protein